MSSAKNNNRPAIAFLCASNSWGGLEMNVLRLAKWINDRGWPVYIYGLPESPLCRQTEKIGLKFRVVDAPTKFRALIKAPIILSQLRQDNCRFLVTNLTRDLPAAALVKKLSGNKLHLIHLQHMHVGGNKKDLIHRLQHKALDAWITPLVGFKNRLLETTTIPESRIHIIPFGMDLEPFTSLRPSKKEARAELNLPTDVCIIGTVGRLDPKKGQDTLVKAAAELHRAGHKVHLLFVGDRTTGEASEFEIGLKKLIDTFGLSDFVHFRPFIDRIEIAYTALDIFVLTSHSETYGMVTIEAMASGLPVVGTDAGGTPKIIEENQTGLLFPPQDVKALSQALTSLIDDPKLSNRLATSAAQQATQKYDYKIQVDSIENILNSLLEDQSS